jgi:hypothetical protein
MGLSE